jgi:Holliday junction resolvasome RuvABC endonuclease subunit
MMDEVVTSYKYGIGIDPGWKNLGFAITRQEIGNESIELVYSAAINPSEWGIIGTVNHLSKIIDCNLPNITIHAPDVNVMIERYVPYNVNWSFISRYRLLHEARGRSGSCN